MHKILDYIKKIFHKIFTNTTMPEKSEADYYIKHSELIAARKAMLRKVIPYLATLDTNKILALEKLENDVCKSFTVLKSADKCIQHIEVYESDDIANSRIPKLDCWLLLHKHTLEIFMISFDKDTFMRSL